jgi:hypothetical protein
MDLPPCPARRHFEEDETVLLLRASAAPFAGKFGYRRDVPYVPAVGRSSSAGFSSVYPVRAPEAAGGSLLLPG